jgi:putative transposase
MPERKVFKFRIEPTTVQAAGLSRYAGARGFIFNWALARRKETYGQTGQAISWADLSAELTELKSQPGLEWLKEIDSQLVQQALADCKRAFANFFAKRAGYPRFKSRKDTRQSFRIPQRVKVEDERVYLPKIGWLKIRQSQPVDCPTKSATFKRDACGRWFVTLVAEFDLPERERPKVTLEQVVGGDVGLNTFLTLSDETAVDNPRTNVLRSINFHDPIAIGFVSV